EFGYILQVIKKLELKKLDDLLGCRRSTPKGLTALSPGYIADSDLEEDEEDPADYPVDRGDDDDDDDEEEEESSEDDKDEKEEHLALAVAFLATNLVSSAKETEPFETDESAATPPPPLPPAYHTTPRMSVRAQTPTPFPSEEEVARILALH
nr:hypothetical protein [Tanacetum cinerariifolium]